MLSGIGMEQLRQGQPPRAGLFASSFAFVAGFSLVFISFGASASAVGSFLRQNRALLAPVAGALILLFGLHLLGALIKINLRSGLILGVVLVVLGGAALVHHGPPPARSPASGAVSFSASHLPLAGHPASARSSPQFWPSRPPATRSLAACSCSLSTPRDSPCLSCSPRSASASFCVSINAFGNIFTPSNSSAVRFYFLSAAWSL